MDLKEILRELEEEESKFQNQHANHLKVMIQKYIKKWKWFLVSMILFLSLSYIFTYFSTPNYKIKTSLILRDQTKGTEFNSNTALNEFTGFKSSSVVENEAEVFKSQSLMLKAIEDLSLNALYYIPNGPLRWKEIYGGEVPIDIKIISKRPVSKEKKSENSLKITLKNKDFFDVETNDGNNITAKFGEEFQTVFGTFIITQNEIYQENVHNKPIKIKFLDKKSFAKAYNSILKVDIVNKLASVIEISLLSEHPVRGEDILDKLIYHYNQEAELEKNSVARNTIAFIDEQLVDLSSELETIEKEAEQYKLNYSITDVSAESQLYLQSTTANRQQISELSVQIDVLESIERYIRKDENKSQLVPSTLSIEDETLKGLIQDFNSLQRERERMLRTTQPNNPIVQNLDQQLESLRIGILENIRNIKDGLTISRNSLMTTADQFQSRASRVPTIERELLDINRNQSIKQQHYLLLTRKREEALLTLASSVSTNSKIIDPPSSSDKPVRPIKILNYIIGVFFGLAIPFTIFTAKDFLSEKIEFKHDVEKLTKVKVLGEISKNKNLENYVAVGFGKKNLIAEQFRYIRSNLNSFGKENEAKVIMVTSGMSGEGKTFFSINLGISLSLSGSSILLMEMDLRKPALTKALDIEITKGISDFLSDNKIKLESIIKKHPQIENIDVIGCGSLPENPSELLGNQKLRSALTNLKNKYNYIIIDTAPVGLVSDALMLADLVDFSIFMVRCNLSTKTQIKTIEDLRQNKRFPNPVIVLNGVEADPTYGYGPKYGANYYVK